jgi:hypothetical protein
MQGRSDRRLKQRLSLIKHMLPLFAWRTRLAHADAKREPLSNVRYIQAPIVDLDELIFFSKFYRSSSSSRLFRQLLSLVQTAAAESISKVP